MTMRTIDGVMAGIAGFGLAAGLVVLAIGTAGPVATGVTLVAIVGNTLAMVANGDRAVNGKD